MSSPSLPTERSKASARRGTSTLKLSPLNSTKTLHTFLPTPPMRRSRSSPSRSPPRNPSRVAAGPPFPLLLIQICFSRNAIEPRFSRVVEVCFHVGTMPFRSLIILEIKKTHKKEVCWLSSCIYHGCYIVNFDCCCILSNKAQSGAWKRPLSSERLLETKLRFRLHIQKPNQVSKFYPLDYLNIE